MGTLSIVQNRAENIVKGAVGVVENGVFNGDAQDLQLLAEQGQIPGTTHMEEGEYQRTDSARNDFLEAHSISDTKGWRSPYTTAM